MKVRITYSTNCDGAESQEMDIVYKDNKLEHVDVYPLYECPEDAIIGRDLVSCDEILKYMQIAYEAGLSGEEMIVTKESGQEDEF